MWSKLGLFKTIYTPKININIHAKSQAGNMSQIYNSNTKRPKPKENQRGIVGISSTEFMHFGGNSAESLGSRRECCWDTYLS